MYVSALALAPLGLIIGSWLGVLIRHWPADRRDLWRRSACDTCGVQLAARDLIPVYSYLALRGHCRVCGAGIGWFALAIELSAAAVGVAAWAADGDAATAWIDAGLGWALLLAAWIDAETFVLPDMITLPLVLAGLAVTWWSAGVAVYGHAAAAAAGYGGFMLLNAAYFALRKRNGLGAGDAKLLAAAGAWLGLAALPQVILLAGVFGLLGVGAARLAGRRVAAAQPVPFGPALAFAFFALRLSGGW